MTGWLWYLIMLGPVIGIMQVGNQARADRYTYLPQIGMYLLLTWGAADLWARWRYRRAFLTGLASVILVALIFCARAQAAYWQDSETLWSHALACTTDNIIAEGNIGQACYAMGKTREAMTYFQNALRIEPKLAPSSPAWGVCFSRWVGRVNPWPISKGAGDRTQVRRRALQSGQYLSANGTRQRGAFSLPESLGNRPE